MPSREQIRERMKAIASDTMEILKQGYYTNTKNQPIHIEQVTKQAIEGTVLYDEEDTKRILQDTKPNEQKTTQILVTNQTTLEAIDELKQKYPNEEILALNFASARHPGGGFLKGSVAQEESLARSSALYYSLVSKPQMYEHNEQLRAKRGCYSDMMIYSPNVPVFKNDKGQIREELQLVSFVTSPAVNKRAIQKNEPHIGLPQIHATMKMRIQKILAVALHHEHKYLVLGAFGCGVFKNSPPDVAGYFHEALKHPKFRGKFKEIVFAVYDTSDSKQTFGAFQRQFKQ